ncbi:MAG: hypothetical protein IAF38_20145, partial [Bacteroidia bacterium]|nr:hypothetical protein [Bacteroidia bacterium]
YEIAAGNYAYAEELLKTIENHSTETGMFPEQIWDAEDIPEKNLIYGKPTGAAMPLVWAHSEYIKLCRSLKEKEIFDMPQQTKKRYLIDKTGSEIFIWSFSNHYTHIPKGKILRVQCLTAATVKWSTDEWATSNELETSDTKIGVHYADLSCKELDHEQKISFTFFWHDSGTEENKKYELTIEKSKIIQKQKRKKAAKPIDKDATKIFLPS